MKSNLQDVALNICELMIKNVYYLEIKWILRDQNEFIDYLSKIMDVYDWGIYEYLFTDL